MAGRAGHRHQRGTLSRAARIELADSALHAPQAGFGGHEFYPDLLDKAAVLVCRLTWNHPLLDGNKRAAWAALAMFLDLNDVKWDPDPPQVDDAEAAMLAIAATQVDETSVADWLRNRTRFPPPDTDPSGRPSLTGDADGLDGHGRGARH